MQPNYVRFVRGTPSAWKNLKDKKADVLYFISEKDSDTGTLYLGSKLISSGDGETFSDISLEDISNISLSMSISDGSILQYDKESNSWVNKILDYPEMIGSTEEAPGEKGLVPKPEAKDRNSFLAGSGEWVDFSAEYEAQLLVLYGTDEKTKSIREIAASEVATIFGTEVPEKFNTIEKIAKWIVEEGQSTETGDGAARLSNLEKVVLGPDKTAKTEGLAKEVNEILKQLHGYQVDAFTYYDGIRKITDDMRGDVDSLQINLDLLQKKYSKTEQTVTDLDTRLKWREC